MSSIFISYSSADRLLVDETFAGLIHALGYEVWIDRKIIRAAEQWEASLAAGLEGADWFLVIVSREAAKSDWVKRETAWAIRNLPNRVIPVVVDDSMPSEIDPRLFGYQHYNYKNEPSRTIEQLVALLVNAKYEGSDRDLSGRWISAVQPVYYPATGWHVQNVEAVSTSDGYRIRTTQETNKLQWRLDGKLVGNAFLVGPWRSTRAGARSQGYMTLQLSRNGTYMCGHDYAVEFEEAKAHFGVLLLARTSDTLEKAWSAMKAAHREMLPLTELHDFTDAIGT